MILQVHDSEIDWERGPNKTETGRILKSNSAMDLLAGMTVKHG